MHEKNPAAVELGRRGGLARARNLSPESLAAIGRMGGLARAARRASAPKRKPRRKRKPA